MGVWTVAGSAHVAVCCEADHTTVARTAEENKVRCIWIPIQDALMASEPSTFLFSAQRYHRVLYHCFRRSGSFLSRFERIPIKGASASEATAPWSQCRKHATRAEKRLEIGDTRTDSENTRLSRCANRCYVSDPLQELRLEWVKRGSLDRLLCGIAPTASTAVFRKV